MSLKDNVPQFEVKLSQCSDCTNSKGIKCIVYGDKPDQYSENRAQCPKKLKE